MFRPLAPAPAQDAFMPHGMCYLWEPALMGLHISSDAVIALAYLAIPPALIYFVVKARKAVPGGDIGGERSLPFEWMWVAFGLFIVACGATHLMGIWTLWEPDYWLSGGVKAVTAIASLATAIALPPLIPRALELLRSARESEARRVRLEEAHAELETLYGKLKEFDELKSEFFANVSHELRTPLALILAPTERLLGSGTLDDESREELAVIRRNARLLHKQVDDLLDVAKLDAGRVEPSRTAIDLSELVRRTASAFSTLAADEAIDFAVETPDRLVAEADPDHLERVLLNLLSNAFRFTPSGGTVRCRMSVEEAVGGGRKAVLSVSDSGPGVAPELREAVFERFRQAERGAGRRHGGTGLGLSIVKDLVELHGGSAGIDDAPEGGARVWVEIPLPDRSLADAPAVEAPRRAAGGAAGAETAAEAREEAGGRRSVLVSDAAALSLTAAESERAARKPAGASGAGLPSDEGRPALEGPARREARRARPRVLIVEDNRDMGRFLARGLSDRYEVRVASDGREGLELARSWIPDLVLTDIMMPGMSGDRMIQAIRGQPELEPVPIVVLSAKADEELRIRLLREGAQDYVTKPFAVEEVRARVGNLIELKRARDILRDEVESREESLEGLADMLAARTRELRGALDEARRARKEAETASAAKSDFLAVISHELRTPLNAMVVFSGLLEEEVPGPLNGEQREHVSRLRANAGTLLELIDKMLAFARGDPVATAPAPEPVDLGRLTADLEAYARPRATRKGLRFVVEAPAEETSAVLHPRRVRHVLTELLDNAIKFTEKGEVGLEVSADPERVRFRVRDTGIGIAEQDLDRIFEPFWQADRGTTRKVKGVGLGLEIARRMARAVDGEITVESVPGEGTVFVLTVPRRSAVTD